MTFRTATLCLTLLLPPLLLSLAACTSTSETLAVADQAKPGEPATRTASRGTATTNAAFVDQGAIVDNTYPTFAVMPHGATTQMSDAEKASFEAEMNRYRNSARRPDETQAEYDARLKEMRELAARHGADTLKQIEN